MLDRTYKYAGRGEALAERCQCIRLTNYWTIQANWDKVTHRTGVIYIAMLNPAVFPIRHYECRIITICPYIKRWVSPTGKKIAARQTSSHF
jgi:hypothetical protein